MRELRIGDRVKTPLGDATIASGEWLHGEHVMRDVVVGSPPMVRGVQVERIEPLPADIPRERVADLHAAVTKRLWMLADEMSHEGHESDDVRGYPHPRICLTCTRDEEHEVEFYVREGADAEIARAAHDELATFAEALRLLLEVDDAE